MPGLPDLLSTIAEGDRVRGLTVIAVREEDQRGVSFQLNPGEVFKGVKKCEEGGTCRAAERRSELSPGRVFRALGTQHTKMGSCGAAKECLASFTNFI